MKLKHHTKINVLYKLGMKLDMIWCCCTRFFVVGCMCGTKVYSYVYFIAKNYAHLLFAITANAATAAVAVDDGVDLTNN